MDNFGERKGKLENLDSRVNKLIAESRDIYFTEYLQKMRDRLIQQRYQVDLLQDELDRSYQMYLHRMKLAGVPVQEAAAAAPHPQMPAQTGETAAAQGVRQTEGIQETAPQEKPAVGPDMRDVSPQYINYLETPPESRPVPVSRKKTGGNVEFTVGAAVLSVVGGAFILAALVTLGMTFMGGLIKGICLYAVSALFVLLSELFLYRRWPKLGSAVSAIGMGGLYLSTALNFLALHNFNLWVTLAITLGITLIVVLLSRRRDSVLYRVIGLIAGYLCFLMIQKGITDTEFLVVSGMVLFLNVLCIAVPVRKFRTGINVTHMVTNFIFTTIFILRATLGCGLTQQPVLIFLFGMLIVQQLLLVAQLWYRQKEALLAGKNIGNAGGNAGILAAYGISTVVYTVIMTILVQGLVDSRGDNWYCYMSAVVTGLTGAITFLVLSVRKCPEKWHVYCQLNLLMFCIFACPADEWHWAVCMFVMLIIAKILMLRGRDVTVVRICDAVITTFICITVAISFYDAPQVYLLLAGLGISILSLNYWQTYYEIILTAVLALYTVERLPALLQLPAEVGILLVGILLFNNVKRWRGKHILIFNILALVGQIICFLYLAAPVYQNAYITYLCMLVFGLATIVLTLHKKYQMDFKGKYMILAVFLTYMAFIFRTTLPVINSILLMVIALVSVGIGFAEAKKAVRIYGLVLSLVVCGKLVLYDFFEAPTLQKTILFFVVGGIALIIAAIYIILEKKNRVSE